MSAYGPYTLPGKLHEYGLSAFAPTAGSDSRCPMGDMCNKQIRSDGIGLWVADEGPAVVDQYDFIFFASAGHDESSTWEEFGSMLFETREDVPDESHAIEIAEFSLEITDYRQRRLPCGFLPLL
jgi:hypothetical protein